MQKLVLILDNIRSLYNVGSIFRTADGAGVDKIYLTGITGYPKMENDTRVPWEVETISNKIHKTALGAEESVEWVYSSSAVKRVDELRVAGFKLIALEKTNNSEDIFSLEDQLWDDKEGIALIVGNEVDGVSPALLELSDTVVHIPMHGVKKSLNVSIATAVAIYELRRRSM